MRRLRLAEVERIRHTPGRSLLLFLTDRCPVGCAHCSVDSRRDSPTISNFELFASVLAGICGLPDLTTVGISGGEPFVERRGLTLAVDRLAAAGKDLVLYTSGVWASPHVPEWIRRVLRKASCAILSTDAFHAAAIDDDRLVRAAQTIAEEGVWLVVQVLKVPKMVRKAEQLLQQAFGNEQGKHAEVNLIPPLPYGRGASVFAPRAGRPGETFAACNMLAAPVVRYDGRISACCNEQVIVGLGPERLRQCATSADELAEALAQFEADSLLNALGGVGAGALTHHPLFADLAQREFSSICELCWAIQERALPLGDRSDRALHAMNAIGLLGQRAVG